MLELIMQGNIVAFIAVALFFAICFTRFLEDDFLFYATAVVLVGIATKQIETWIFCGCG